MKKNEKANPTLATMNFVGISVCATFIFTILFGEDVMLPLRLIMALVMVAVATLLAIGEKNLWLMVGASVSAVALMVAEPAGGLAYFAYIAAMYIFFSFNPSCKNLMKEWVKGVFAPEKDAKA